MSMGGARISGSAGVLAGQGVNAGHGVNAGQGLDAGEDAGGPGVSKGWYSRGYLPHCDSRGLFQSITYRLSDSLPRQKLDQLEDELATLPYERRHIARRQQIEAWLDAGMGCCALRHPDVARYVQHSFLHFHGQRYHLHAWCVMPNHVHVLIEPVSDLASIVQGWKSFTARWILKHGAALGVSLPQGRALWMREYWDRYIRDENHYRKTVDYIHQNPVKAGLCARPEAWLWSSAGSSGVLARTGAKADEDVGAPRSARC